MNKDSKVEPADRRNPAPVHYGDYLQLDKLLDSQRPESPRYGAVAHDEMLFIITHQAYELWFKQIVYELKAITGTFQQPRVEEAEMGRVIHLLERVRVIQGVLLQQIDVIETMTPLDFLEFRDLLVPASGFQSLQFKEIEILLGVRKTDRIPTDRDFFQTRLRPAEREHLSAMETQPSLLDLTEQWLGRMPFLQFQDFDFWQQYQSVTERMLSRDRQIIQSNPDLSENQREVQLASIEQTAQRFAAVVDRQRYQQLRLDGEFRFHHQAFLAALFIHLYRDHPLLYLPFRYLTLLVEIDEALTNWRTRHALMVQRMLGRKIGTGGSSGHDYLSRTTQANRVFLDLYALSTFLVPRFELPKLPETLVAALGFHFTGRESRT